MRQRSIGVKEQGKILTLTCQNEDWYTKDWHKDIEIMPGIAVNIGEYLTKKGSIYA